MSRGDLLALTPESLAALANLGLVKRAQRELAAGEGPDVSEDAAGVVTGTFKDGVVARLLPNTTLKETPCSCGAAGVCRHRVAVALAYRERQARVPEVVPVSIPKWWLAEIEDSQLELLVGPRAIVRARALTDAGLLVEVDPGAPPERPSSVQLPTCTVQFLVPGDLAYARCSCVATTGCEHVAVAVWAFRAARDSEARQVHLGKARSSSDEAWGQALGLTREIVQQGVANGTADIVQRFARVRAELARARLVWPLTIVEDLEQQLEAYHARSSRYRARVVADLVTELELRARAARGRGQLPPAFITGADEADDTLLDHVRLIGLGAHVESDGHARLADVFLADPDAGLVLILRKRWEYDPAAAPEDGPALARRNVAARATLGALAHGQIVSKGVRRRANRSLTIGTNRVRDTSVTPQDPDWGRLPSTILVRDFAAYEAERRQQPPKMLRPRLLAEHMRVLAVEAVSDVVYLPAEQQILAALRDASGAQIRLAVRHRAVAPHAVDAVGAALGAGLRFVAGDIRLGAAGMEIDPVALVTDGLIVPDLVAAPAAWKAPHVARGPNGEALDAVLADAESAIEEGIQLGLAVPRRDWLARVAGARTRLDDAGFASIALRFAALEREARGSAGRATGAWVDASARLALARHLLG